MLATSAPPGVVLEDYTDMTWYREIYIIITIMDMFLQHQSRLGRC